jgi:membrane protein DedA with SNARE-associated domain/rhodanese-related sulfurtransferase
MTQLLEWVQQYGLFAVFFNVLAEQIGAPIPAYPMLIVAGAMAAQGHYSVAAVLVVAVIAALIADLIWYAAGGRYGERVLRVLCRVSLSPDSCVRQTESIFTRWGSASLMVAKFIPGFASVATAISGVLRIHLGKFILFDGIGALLWAGLGIAIGYIFNAAIEDILSAMASLGRWGLIFLVSAFALFALSKWWQRHRFIAALKMNRITVSELQEMIESGQAPAIIDVRSEESQHRSGRIPGAISMQKVDATAADVIALAQTREVIVYCACPNEASAATIAKALIASGALRVRPLLGGIDAWRVAGYPVERA